MCHRLWALLLGNTPRIIRVKLALSCERFNPRKLFSVNPKTLGDFLIVKRYEADLAQVEVAAELRVSDVELRSWEYNQVIPSESRPQLLVMGEVRFNAGSPK